MTKHNQTVCVYQQEKTVSGPCTFSAVNVTLRLNCFSRAETALKLSPNMFEGRHAHIE